MRSGLDAAAVDALFPEGDATPLLKAVGLVRPDGSASADAHRKLKQVNHLMTLLQPALTDVFERHPWPTIVDFGSGKSALSLVLASAWPHRHGRGELLAVEQRLDLMQKADAAARQASMTSLRTVPSSILAADLPDRIHFGFALHACDVATDHALVRSINAHADYIAVVPCCQAELGRQLQDLKHGTGLPALWHRPWHRREFGAHLTNVLRVLALQCRGYQVTVTELAGWEHAVKNELIIARKVARYHRQSVQELQALLAQIPVRPWLLQELGLLGGDAGDPGDSGDGGDVVEPTPEPT